MVLAEQNDEWIEARRYTNQEAVQRPVVATLLEVQLVEPERLAEEAV